MKKNKEVLINLRLKSDIREDFRIAAELRGATMSGLLHQFIVRTIREEKDRDPDAFARLKNTDLPEGEQPSKEPFDPKTQPAQAALYQRFLNEQKATTHDKSKEESTDPSPMHANEIVPGKVTNESGKGDNQT